VNLGAFGNTKEASKSATGPDFSLACDPAALVADAGGSVSSTCAARSLVGFSGEVSLACPAARQE